MFKEDFNRTKEQEKIVNQRLIFLTKKDVMKITGWSEGVTARLFAYDDTFPAIKIGKSYQVELNALITYCSERRVKERE